MSQKILNDKEQKMETKDELIEEVRALSAAAEKARGEFYSAAVRLADAVVQNRDTIRDLKGTIGWPICAFIEADECYTKAVDEVTEACDRLSRFLKGGRKVDVI